MSQTALQEGYQRAKLGRQIGADGTRFVAIVSVTQKEGIAEFCRGLNTITPTDFISTGGTARLLRQAGIEGVFDAQDLVGGPELFDDLVKTLSREVAAGIMAPKTAEAESILSAMDIPRINMVCVDFYNLRDAICQPDATRQSVVKNTDVGGPTMTHEAAKAGVIIICRPQDRQPTLDWMRAGRPDEEEYLQELRARAEIEGCKYLGVSARYHSGGKFRFISGEQVGQLRYGENPQQTPANLYATDGDDPLAIHRFIHVAGKEASLINVTDLDRLLAYVTRIAAAWKLNFNHVPKIAVAVKHGNACGAAAGNGLSAVLQGMINGDLRAIFGGAVMTNFAIDSIDAEILRSYKMGTGNLRLLDEVIAPEFSSLAIDKLARKGDRCRMVANETLADLGLDTINTSEIVRSVRGGFLIQPGYDSYLLNLDDPRIQKYGEASEKQKHDMVLAWAIGSLSNSNTITLVRDWVLIGNGVGQQDRVGGCDLAILRAKWAGHETDGATVYSDSFFPFPDGPEHLVQAGVKAIFATSGSVNDDKTIQVCQDAGIVLYMIPDKVGRGFAYH